ncbi:MAG TPA: proton-conducting transporter membrane subunit, partial [Bacteroidia bacterium]|nr:proton-conducting transporter membrane subunit [Bacteroidia bacterium]
MVVMTWAALIPLFPLIGFAILGGSGSKLSKGAAGFLASASVFISFLFSIAVFAQVLGSPVAAFKVQIFDWIQIGSYNLGFSFLFDRLSAVMLLVVTGVGFLIHVYSIGYMHEDNDFNRFFAYLNLFIFFMLLLVLGSNFLVLFAGWEGVGLCSYLLIGFWFSNNEYNAAARKAFVMNRIGDLAFLIALLLLFYNFNSLEFDVVFSQASSIGAGDQLLFIISILLFIGATGKSAQIPLFTWLPDAMAGPTPVSALIHAAT